MVKKIIILSYSIVLLAIFQKKKNYSYFIRVVFHQKKKIFRWLLIFIKNTSLAVFAWKQNINSLLSN